MRPFRYLLVAAALLAGGLVASALSLRLSRHAFTGYDVSPMIDAGWRVLSGQAPGSDFIVTFPPSLYLAVALSFHFFGVTWHAIALGEVILYLAMLILGLRLAALLPATRPAVLAAAAYTHGQTILLISINYPWHASMAQSFASYAFLATLVLLLNQTAPIRRTVEPWAHLTLAVTLLLLSKPNSAYPAILACLAILVLARPFRVLPILAVTTSAPILASLALHRVHTTLWQMLHSYLGLTGRMLPRGLLLGITGPPLPHYALVNLLVYAILAPVLTASTLILWQHRTSLPHKPVLLLALAAIVVSLCGMATNYDFKLTDTPLILLAVTILAAYAAPQTSPDPINFRLYVTSLVLLAFAAYLGRARYRMLWNEPACPVETTIADPFLGSMKVCDTLANTLTETDRILAENPQATIFFGPSMEFLYAGRHLPSPPHLPNWWDIGTSFARKQTPQVAATWADDRFDLLIFGLPENRLMMPGAIAATIDRDFVPITGTTFIHAYRRR